MPVARLSFGKGATRARNDTIMMRTRRVTPTYVADSNPAVYNGGLATRPAVIGAADTHDVMREQLEYLIQHAGSGICGCEQCESYTHVRTALMKIFQES